jgi:hypothetical protein
LHIGRLRRETKLALRQKSLHINDENEETFGEATVSVMTEETIEEVFGLCCSNHGLDHRDVFVESMMREEEEDRH